MSQKIILDIQVATEQAGAQPSINYAGGSHVAGFSEGFWLQVDDLATAIARARLVGQYRATLLPRTSRVVLARIYAGGSGASTIVPLGFDGGTLVTDLVNCAVLLESSGSGSPTPSRWWVHNVPDSQLTGGEFTPSLAYRLAMTQYIAAMQSTFFRAFGQNGRKAIVSIDQTGLVTTNGNHTFSVGNRVTIARTTKTDGKRTGGTFAIATIGPNGNQFTMTGWTAGATTGGSVYIKESLLWPRSNIVVRRAGTRRVGRPFDLYRGRRSARQRSA